jgi:hypothetical protein
MLHKGQMLQDFAGARDGVRGDSAAAARSGLRHTLQAPLLCRCVQLAGQLLTPQAVLYGGFRLAGGWRCTVGGCGSCDAAVVRPPVAVML